MFCEAIQLIYLDIIITSERVDNIKSFGGWTFQILSWETFIFRKLHKSINFVSL